MSVTGLISGVQQEAALPEEASSSHVPFEVFFDSVWSDLLAFSRTLTLSEHRAEEIAQEALTRVYVRYRVLSDPRPYTFRVAANLVRRAWSEAARLELRDPTALPESLVAADLRETLDAVRRLPRRLSAVVLLHYYADLPIDTVARLIHRPSGTVKQRLHEARRTLALTLQEDAR